MKPKLLLLILLLVTLNSMAQETIAVVDKLTPDVTVKYNVLSSDKKTMQGLYQAFYKKKTPVASGKYENGKRAGTWHFFDKKGQVVEHFNYTTQTLTYEAPDDSTTRLKYIIDEHFTPKDTINKPIRIGGRYFGYLNYLNLFKLPHELAGMAAGLGNLESSAYIELLVSPAGRLADFRVHIVSPQYGEKVLAVNIDHLSDEDKVFIPAALNGREIASRIVIICDLQANGRLSI